MYLPLYWVGWKYGPVVKDIYKDGHERNDVKIYRAKYLEAVEKLKKNMQWHYHGENLEKLTPSLEVHDKEFIAHDESIMYSCDGKVCIWHDFNRPPIRPKGAGTTIMISVFLSARFGVLSCDTINPGIRCELWFPSCI